MKKMLKDLLCNLKYVDIVGSTDISVSQLCLSSTNVEIKLSDPKTKTFN